MALRLLNNTQFLHSITSRNGSDLVLIEEQTTSIQSGPIVQLLNINQTNMQNIHISSDGFYSRIKATQNRKKRMQLAIKSRHTANCFLFKRIILNFGPTWPNSQLTNEQSVDQTGPRQESSRGTWPVTLHCTGLWDTPGAVDCLELSQLRMFKFSWSCSKCKCKQITVDIISRCRGGRVQTPAGIQEARLTEPESQHHTCQAPGKLES